MTESFAGLLAEFRERAGRSRNNLAHQVAVDASYLTRIEHGERAPPRPHIVAGIARALRLSAYDRNRLLVAAGYLPTSVSRLGRWDECLQVVADVLNDPHLSASERQHFKDVVALIAAQWRGDNGLGG